MLNLDTSVGNIKNTINLIHEAISVNLSQATTNQRYALIGCLVLSFACYFIFKNNSTNCLVERSAKQIAEVIPTKEQLLEIVRLELAKRESLTKPILVSLTAS